MQPDAHRALANAQDLSDLGGTQIFHVVQYQYHAILRRQGEDGLLELFGWFRY